MERTKDTFVHSWEYTEDKTVYDTLHTRTCEICGCEETWSSSEMKWISRKQPIKNRIFANDYFRIFLWSISQGIFHKFSKIIFSLVISY